MSTPTGPTPAEAGLTAVGGGRGGPVRAALLRAVADRVPTGGRVRVGIDGVDGAGKTWFADELADVLRLTGRPAVRVSLDDFHQPRAVRYRLGQESPLGFWRDSYDYPRFWADVLTPFGAGRYRDRSHDLATDQVLDPPWQQAPEDAVLVVDGIFAHRDELAGAWNCSVFLQVSFAETARRMAVRDGGPSPGSRYREGQRIYLAECDPVRRASLVVDNGDLAAPRFVTGADIASA